MLALLGRCGRRGLPQVARARNLGFLSDLRKKVGEELSKNEGLQQSLKELREHDAVKGAREVAKRAEDALKQAKVKAGELAQEAQTKVRDSALTCPERWRGTAALPLELALTHARPAPRRACRRPR
jgi:hypothetical protein